MFVYVHSVYYAEVRDRPWLEFLRYRASLVSVLFLRQDVSLAKQVRLATGPQGMIPKH